jgi:hypothetical protein
MEMHEQGAKVYLSEKESLPNKKSARIHNGILAMKQVKFA